jgi:hypothetical protein
MSGYRDEVKPASNAGKVVVLLVGLTLLAVLIGARLFGSNGVDEMAQGALETIMPTEAVQMVAPTAVVVEPTATVGNLLAPNIEAAIISPTDDGDRLNMSGSADIACVELVGFLDGIEVGRTAPTASGTWALNVPAPAVGRYDAVIKCVTDSGEFTAPPVKIEVPENPSQEPAGADASQSPAVTDTVESAPVATDTVESAAPPPATVDQPEFTFANQMNEWIGGPLLVRGSAEANSEIELIFDDGVQPILVTATANAEGRFASRVILTQIGEYAVTAQYAGTQGQPSATVVVPPDVNFGAPGNCVGTIPPFGTIDGDLYIVNDCEYFSLIANRLGVSYRDLLAVNRNILNPNNLRAGDRIQIPPLP